MMASFPVAQLKAINVNMKNGEITFSLGVTLSDENFEEAKKLERFLQAENAMVALKIEPAQMSMNLTRTAKEIESG
jgi:hypothetical protein